MGGAIGLCAGRQAVQHEEVGCGRQMRPQNERLVEMRHEELTAALGDKRRGDGGGAEAVAVGLDHGCARSATKPPAQASEVRGDRIEIDLEQCAGMPGLDVDHDLYFPGSIGRGGAGSVSI